MIRPLQISIVILVSAMALSCGGPAKPTADEAYTAFRSAISEVETPAEKAALCEAYLRDYPNSERAGSLAGAVAYYRGHQMEDAEGAVTVLDELLGKVDDPETRFKVRMARFPLARDLDRPADLDAIVADLENHRPLTFGENLEVGELAAEYEMWDLAEDRASAAAALATVEAFQADHPETELTDEELTLKAEKRQVLAAAARGQALTHLDRTDEALAVFEAAEPLSRVNYLGVPETDLFAIWGQSVLEQGDPEKALTLLGPTAVLGDNDEAMEAYREAFTAVHGEQANFESFVWTQREKLARVIDDFELPTYDGTLKRISDFRGRVVFLSFWFPT